MTSVPARPSIDVPPGTVVVHADISCPWAHLAMHRLHETRSQALRRAFFAESCNVSMRHELLAVAASCNGAVQGGPHLFLPDVTSAHNPGISLHWVGQYGVGFPVVAHDEPTVYHDLLQRAASSLDTDTGPDDAALAAARYQGARVTEMARALIRRHQLEASA